jgi:hypothetical protein
MSFIPIKTNTRNRLNENLQFLNYISSVEPVNPRDTVSLEVNIMKGLFYVHLYSTLEKTINELAEQTIILINTKSISTKHFNHTFNSIALYNELKSFKDCGHRNFFAKAYDIFIQINNNNPASLNETLFSNNLQNVWFKTIEEISLCFGVKGINTSARVKATINEIVDKRNAVAHGRENAADVGSRFRTPMIRIKYNEIANFTYQLIDLYDEYFSKKDYLKVAAKRLYI